MTNQHHAVKALRERAGYTQVALAEAVRVDVAAVRNWDARRRRPRYETMVALAGVLGVSLEELMAAFAADRVRHKRRRARKAGSDDD
jgi:transcriptional regulator with XRE-family HTH domain